VAFGATLAQFVLGPLLFLTLPAHVVSTPLVLILALVVAPLAALAVWWLWQEVNAPEPGRRLVPVALALTVVVGFMVYARHNVRETALAPHRALMAARTAEYMAQVQAAQDYVVLPGGLGGKPVSAGEQLFQRRCGSCHAVDRRLVGPPMTEAAKIYAGNPEG
jgi:cytochrome c